MKVLRPRRYSRQLVRLLISLSLIVATLPIAPRSSARVGYGPQGRSNPKDKATKKGKPAPAGPPAFSLPNLKAASNRQTKRPAPPASVASTMRSRRKPLVSRHGLKVGDRLPKRKKAELEIRPPNATTTALSVESISNDETLPHNRGSLSFARNVFQFVTYESLNVLLYSGFGVDGIFRDVSFSSAPATLRSKTRESEVVPATAMLLPDPSTSIVISQIYGGGGNTGATYKNDFIELYNRGNTTIDLTGWSVQYAAATGLTWTVTSLSGSLAAGHYYLVKEAQGAGGTTNLPTPEATGNIDLNATAGKVVLANSSTALSGSCPSSSNMVDLVGYGSSSNCYEGNGAAPAPSNTTSIARASLGCIEIDNNPTDFDAGSVNPRNSTSTANTCSTPSGSSTVVISEFRTRGPNGGNDEFVEIYNRSNAAIDIGGWKITASNNAGAIGTRVTIAANTSIPKHGHFLATNNATGGYGGSVSGDQTYSTGISDDGGIALTNASDTIIDQVGLSSGSAFKENRVLTPLTTNVNRGYERRPGGTNGSATDTDDSPSDFQIKTPSDPQNLQSAATPNELPTASVGGPYSGFIAQNVPFFGSGSDSDGTIVSYSWTFGDGGTGSGTAPTHAYTNTGTYTVILTVTDNQGGQGSSSTTVSIVTSTSDQYSQNFLQMGLGRTATNDETSYWSDITRAAYPQGSTSMRLVMTEFGMTVFESLEYSNRNRTNHQYVYDLYKTYLMREPDPEGWQFWTEDCDEHGREQVRNAFEESIEFHNIADSLTSSGAPSSAAKSLATARVDLFNQSGDQIRARDGQWSTSLLSLPGRAGLDLGLGVSYSSLVWTRSGPYVYFDSDRESLSPGFQIGFPVLQGRTFDAQTAKNVYLLITASGQRVELRQTSTAGIYESADSSYMQLTDHGGSLTLYTPDGLEMEYSPYLGNWCVTQIKDRNGNLITVTNTWRGDIQTITDTLNRTLTFVYDANDNLNEIRQSWANEPQPHVWATFGWGTQNLQTAFSVEAVGIQANETIPVLDFIGFGDGSYAKFSYNSYGQVNQISTFASDSDPQTDSHQLNSTTYGYDSLGNDCPRILQSAVTAENWTGMNDVPSSVITYFADNGDGTHQTSLPDETVVKEYFGSGWQTGLVIQTDISGRKDPDHSVELQKQSITTWTQDDPNPNANYRTNPRITVTDVTDNTNHRHTVTGYDNFTLPSGLSCSLPNQVDEYNADQSAVLRRTVMNYRHDSDYVNSTHRIIGLVSEKLLYEGTSTLVSKMTYDYDLAGFLQDLPSAPIQHDASYSTQAVEGRARGNLVNVARWDVTDLSNNTKTENKIGYDIAGNVVFTRDALNHQTTISYADQFALNGTDLDTPLPFTTFAYPTSIIDPDSYTRSQRYRYDFGAPTWKQTPQPNTTTDTPGPEQKFDYDDVARPLRITNLVNGAYTRYDYQPTSTSSYSTVNVVADEAYAAQVFDGVGRTIASVRNHPTTNGGGFSAVLTVYDVVGRAIRQSNPTDTDTVVPQWQATGDDALASGGFGWVYTQQAYDWKGRPLMTVNPSITGNPVDTTTKEVTYDGCGCAGGEVVTLKDEVGRQQKVYSDVLGRQVKTEVLDWDSNVYSTTTNRYNALDQVTRVRQYVGTAPFPEPEIEGSGYQTTTMSYDGYGRLQSKHVPEQQVDPNFSGSTDHATWAYKADDTIESVTDARGAKATYEYNNNRHLVSHISYDPASGGADTPDVWFGYDAAGNRTSMTDGLGGASYGYDSLSRLRSENRDITGVGSYQISYDYNLANQLSSITDPYNVTVNYTRDTTGRISEISNSSTTYASGIQYRAWGNLKHLNYGNGQALDASYNSRMLTSTFTVTGMTSAMMSKTYDYFADGQLRFSSDQFDHRFDRSYGFDHAGRLTQALSGAEARVEAATNDRPYIETLSYDSFNHPTYRNIVTWSDGGVSTTDSYTNNRHDSEGGAWQYDADGRMTREPEGPFTYDAAGQNVAIETPVSTASTGYDGDGRQIRTEEHTITGGGFFVDTTYYIRSTVLGGQVLNEFSSNGSSLTYVYAGVALLARHQRVSGSEQILWERRDPSGASVKHGFAEQELEPFGADAGRSEQTVIPNEGAVAPMGSSFNMANPAMTYTIDGLRATLDSFVARMGRILEDPIALIQVTTQPVGYRARGYVSGHPFEVTTDINRDVTGVHIGNADPYDELSFLTTGLTSVTPIYSSSWSLLAGLQPQKPDSFQKALDNAIDKSKAILQDDSDCSKFFGSNAVAALEALAKKLTLANNFKTGITTNTGISQSYDSTIVVNVNNVVAYRLPTSAEVYRNGPFFMSPGAKPIGGYTAGSVGAQITSILHELAHDILTDPKKHTPLIPNDGTDPSLSAKNTQTVLKHCAKEIFNAAK